MNCNECKHRMQRVFEKCRPTLWKDTVSEKICRTPMCAFYEPIKENQNEQESSSG